MPLQKIQLRPGINRDGTSYTAEGGYYACDKIRFRSGNPEKIGGWVKYNEPPLLGSAKGLYNWTNLQGDNLLGVGTHLKYFIETSGGFYDVTPIRRTVTLGANPFAAVAGSATITVTDSLHGAVTGDFVTFTNTVGFAGIPSATFNREYQIIVTSPTTYKFDLTGTAVPNATGSGGGSAISAAYQINSGSDIAVPGFGWGAGTWSRGGWNTPATSGTFTTLRLWTQESFGENHVFAVRNGPIYYAVTNNLLALANRATKLSSQPGANQVPLMATKLVMSATDRHLVAFGVNPIGSTVQDPLLIRWCDTENVFEWEPRIDNAAGEQRIGTGNRIVTALRTRQEILVFTDGQVHAMQYIGDPYIFNINVVGETISIASPNAAIAANNVVYWMGNDKFYVYSGRVDTLPCTLSQHVFENINKNQLDQVFVGTNEGYNEVWWFYCSADSNKIDSYVIYNYLDRLWYYGSLYRTAWLESPSKTSPIAAGLNQLYFHEVGNDDGTGNPLASFIETGDFDLGDGENYVFVKRILPDLNFQGSTSPTPAVSMTLTPRNESGSAYRAGDTVGVARTAVVPVEQFTEQCHVRLRGRQIKLRIDSTAVGVQWALGAPRVEIQPDGRK